MIPLKINNYNHMKFSELGIHDDLLDAIDYMGFEKATPKVKSLLIQEFGKQTFKQDEKKQAINRRSKGR